mgnify:CR=1 FL=1
MKNKAKIIAVSGKGGVGKTSISASIVKILVSTYPDAKILVIDADPAIGLSTALGIEPTSTIDDIRKAIVEDVEDGNTREAIELLAEARYRIFDAMVEQDGFAFIAIGRPESSGCYCSVNSYLRDIISLLCEEFDYVVIDGEAGIEQINRRVMERVSHLILITDPSKKGTKIVQTIKDVADELVMYDEIGAVVNRINDQSLWEYIDTGKVPILSYIPEDKNLAAFDIQGKSIFNLPEGSNIIVGVREVLEKIKIL